MSAELLAALAPFLDRLKKSIQSDARLRAEVAALGKALSAWCETSAESKPQPLHVPTPITPLPPVAPALPLPPAPTYGRRFEDPVVSAPPVVQTPPPVAHEETSGWMPQEPSIIAGRCRAKGDAAKLIARRIAGAIDESKFLEESAEIRNQAEKWPKCALWMLDMATLSRSATVWEDLAGGYHTAADAAEFLQVATEPASKAEPDQILTAMNLAAEAQSLLFAAVIDTGNARPDADQIQLYVTVRELAAARGTYIHRYLRREDRVDPRNWPDLKKRIAAAMEPFVAFQKKSGNTKKILANLKFKLRKALAEGIEKYDEWPRVMELLDEAMGGGVAPHHPELREALLPVIELLPEDVMVPVSVTAVVREIDRYLAAESSYGSSNGTVAATPVIGHEQLRGRCVVLVGGQPRPSVQAELVRAFEWSGIIWIDPDKDLFEVERAIANPDVPLVLFAVRWAGHDFPDIRRLCATYAKRLVRLPGSYSARAVADELAAQAESSLVIA